MKLVYANITALILVLLFGVLPAIFVFVVMVAVGWFYIAGLVLILIMPMLVVYSRQACVVWRGRIIVFLSRTVLRCSDRPVFRVDGSGVHWRLVAEVGGRSVDVLIAPTPPWSSDEEIGARMEAAADRLRAACQ